MLYTEADLEASMDKIETINFHEEKDVLGIKFWAYNAGHVLGAAMFMIEIAGVKVRNSNLTKMGTQIFFLLILDFVYWRFFEARRPTFNGGRNPYSTPRCTYYRMYCRN